MPKKHDISTPNILKNLMLATCHIAKEAGKKIIDVYQKDFKVIEKPDQSPLTEADMASHYYIVEQLEKLSSYPILSEESAKLPFSERSQWQTYWLIDPLDGTKQFVQKTDEFCVCIALIHKHQAVLGVIHLPVSQETYYACQGEGAFKQNSQQEGQTISTKACSLTSKQTSPTWRIAVSRSHSKGDTQTFLKNLGKHDLHISGSAIKACWAAEGKVDLYPRLWPTSEWDTAAAQCILEQAGGELTTLDGKAMQYNTKDDLTNPYFFASAQTHMNWAKYL
jgi:3'(2'), 5'-bisphosphate nucleotidase